jgi:hypothetical protein
MTKARIEETIQLEGSTALSTHRTCERFRHNTYTSVFQIATYSVSNCYIQRVLLLHTASLQIATYYNY